MIRKNTKVSIKKSSYPFLCRYAKAISPEISTSVSGTIIKNNKFSEEETKKIQILRERMLSRISSRPKGSVNAKRDWIIDDSELAYIEIPARKQVY